MMIVVALSRKMGIIYTEERALPTSNPDFWFLVASSCAVTMADATQQSSRQRGGYEPSRHPLARRENEECPKHDEMQ